VLVIDVVVKVVLNCYVRISKAVVSLHNLYVEGLSTPSKDTWKHCVKLVLLYVHLLADTKEDLNLVIKQVVRIACVFVAVVPELRELRNSVSIKPIVARPSWR